MDIAKYGRCIENCSREVLFARLHYELNYPLTVGQAKKIKVTPHAEEGVPPA